MRKHVRVVILVACLLAAGGCVLAAPKVKARAGKPRELWVAFTCSVNGKLAFCGTCGHIEYGAMPQKAAMLKRWRNELPGPLIVLDSGNCLGFGSDARSAPVMVQAMDLCGYSVANVGDDEAAFGPRVLLDAAKGTSVQWVSCNVRLAKGDKQVFPASKIVKVGGLRVALIGVFDKRALPYGFPPSADLTVHDGIQCAKQEAQRLRGKYDVLIVLAHAPADAMLDYARAVPEAALIAGGSQMQRVPEPKMIGTTLVFQPAKYQIARVKLALKGDKYVAARQERITVYKSAPVDEDVARMIEVYQKYGR